MTSATRPWGAIRERTVDASSAGDPVLTWILVGAGLAFAWIITYAAGGSHTSLPHAFYVPVIIGAIRFRGRTAVVVAVAAGIAAGPLLPLDSADGTAQDLGNWVTRLVIFVLVGLLTAYLSQHSLPSLADEVSDRRFRRELEAGIDGGELRMEYQPIVSLRDGSVAGVEALLRWDHPEQGPVPPDRFICRAEQLGCIGAVTRFVLAEVCRQVEQWRDSSLGGRSEFIVSVNASAYDVADPSFVEAVLDELDRHRVPRSWLHLEITETALIHDVDAAAATLRSLRDAGVRLAIDDFGTGESSLGHLELFPVEVLKVDRLFLRRITEQHADDALLHGIAAMAHAMGVDVVAEGVETEQQARAVRELGYDFAQGWLFSRSVRPEVLGPMLESADASREDNQRRLGLRDA